MQAARAVTRSISGVASGVADSAAAQDDADEERRRNARASWKRATTKVASALRLARGAQREGEAAGALDGMEEDLELARREEEELMREAEEDNRLVFIERVKAAAFAVSDLMMRDLMAFIVSYPVKCLELMRDMESALPDESMDPPAFGGIMGMLRGQGPLFCVRRMYSGFGCALVAQMGGTLLEEAPFFVCRALGLFERDSALANSAFAVVYTSVVVAVPFKLVGEAAVVRRVFAACSSSPSPPSPVVVQFAQAFRALFVRREVPWWVLVPRALSTFALSYMVKCSMLRSEDTEPDIWLSNFVSAIGLSPPLLGAGGGGGGERGAAGRRYVPVGTYLFRMCFIRGGVKEGGLSDEVVLNLQWALGLFVSLALNPPITVENRISVIRSFPWLFQPIFGCLWGMGYNSLDGWVYSQALGLWCLFAGHRAWLNRYPHSRSGMIRRLLWRHQRSEILDSILVSVSCNMVSGAVSSTWLKLRQHVSSLVFEDPSQRLVRKLRHARAHATRARGHIDLGSKPAPGPGMQRETTMALKTAAAASVGEKHSALLDRLVVHYEKLADGMDRRCAADIWHRFYLQTGVFPLEVSRSDLDETVGEIGLILPVPLVLGLRVKFVGEEGQDAGGLFRELLSLLSHHFEHELTEGGKKGGEVKSGEGVRAETGAGAGAGAENGGGENERGTPQDQQQEDTFERAYLSPPPPPPPHTWRSMQRARRASGAPATPAGTLSPPSMHPLAPVPVGHTRFSWVAQGGVVPVGHTAFSWNSNSSPPPGATSAGVATDSVRTHDKRALEYSPVKITGVGSGKGDTVNGTYFPVPGEQSGGKPVYKEVQRDAWIEFNCEQQKWQVKTKENKGTATCWMGTREKCGNTNTVDEVTGGWDAYNASTKKWEEQTEVRVVQHVAGGGGGGSGGGGGGLQGVTWVRGTLARDQWDGEYEGFALKGVTPVTPHIFGRMHWGTRGTAYHGEVRDGAMSGKGTFFFPNGDMLEGCFEANKPKGAGILTVLKTGERFQVEYDDWTESAVPVVKTLVQEPLYLEETLVQKPVYLEGADMVQVRGFRADMVWEKTHGTATYRMPLTAVSRAPRPLAVDKASPAAAASSATAAVMASNIAHSRDQLMLLDLRIQEKADELKRLRKETGAYAYERIRKVKAGKEAMETLVQQLKDEFTNFELDLSPELTNVELSPGSRWRASVPSHLVSVVAKDRGIVGDYSHCTDVDGVLAYSVPLRAHRPLQNSAQLVGKIAVVQIGSCSVGKKLRYVQAAGAIAMLVIGTDMRTDLDSVGQKLRACQIHEGNPLEDDPWPEGEVPAPVVTAIPVCYVQGVYEKYFPHGAHVQLRFFPGAPGTPEGCLEGAAYVKQLYESPWKTPSESPFEVNYAGRGVYYRAILVNRYPIFTTKRARMAYYLRTFRRNLPFKMIRRFWLDLMWLPHDVFSDVYRVDYGDGAKEVDVPVHLIRRWRKPDSLFVRGPDGGLMPQRLPPVSLRGESLDAAAAERMAERRRYFFVVGRLMALAIVRRTPLDVTWSRCIYKVLVGEAITLADVKRLDPDFVRHRILPLLEAGGVARMEEILCDELFFVAVLARQDGEEAEEDVVELVPGGKGIRVTEQNKKRYVELLVEHYVLPCCRAPSLASLIEGFYDIIPRAILLESCKSEEGDSASRCSGLSALDLELMVCGVPSIDVGEWRLFTRDNSEGAFPHLLGLLWEVVEEMDTANRAKLLAFACGSGRLPAGGFAGLVPRFNIEVNKAESKENLPSAHTCFNQLCLPNYQEKEQLRSKLLLAISSDAGFGFL